MKAFHAWGGCWSLLLLESSSYSPFLLFCCEQVTSFFVVCAWKPSIPFFCLPEGCHCTCSAAVLSYSASFGRACFRRYKVLFLVSGSSSTCIHAPLPPTNCNRKSHHCDLRPGEKLGTLAIIFLTKPALSSSQKKGSSRMSKLSALNFHGVWSIDGDDEFSRANCTQGKKSSANTDSIM